MKFSQKSGQKPPKMLKMAIFSLKILITKEPNFQPFWKFKKSCKDGIPRVRIQKFAYYNIKKGAKTPKMLKMAIFSLKIPITKEPKFQPFWKFEKSCKVGIPRDRIQQFAYYNIRGDGREVCNSH